MEKKKYVPPGDRNWVQHRCHQPLNRDSGVAPAAGCRQLPPWPLQTLPIDHCLIMQGYACILADARQGHVCME